MSSRAKASSARRSRWPTLLTRMSRRPDWACRCCKRGGPGVVVLKVKGQGVHAGAAQGLGGGGQRGRVAAVEPDGGTGLGQRLGHGQPQAATGASDQGHAAVQIEGRAREGRASRRAGRGVHGMIVPLMRQRSVPPHQAEACPCGRPAAYADCCGRYHAGPLALQAPDPESLMRSRYSAFVKDLRPYLLATLAPRYAAC